MATWQELRMPYEAAGARTRYALALRRTDAEEDAALELRAAAATFERLGAVTDARATKELLAGPAVHGLDLSEREIDVLSCLAAGARDEDIARRLKISIRTVRSYLDRIRDKTGLRRRSALTRYAIEHGIIVPAGHLSV